MKRSRRDASSDAFGIGSRPSAVPPSACAEVFVKKKRRALTGPTSPAAADTAAAAAADVSELSGASVLSAGLASVLLLAAAQLF